MTSTLPTEIQDVFERFVTTEFVTIDREGRPIAWPVTPYYRRGDVCIDVSTGLGYPKKANDAQRNPNVALLFSEPKGSGLEGPPMVLVQGTARVDDEDLRANADRYYRESEEKVPGAKSFLPPKPVQRFFDWYYLRVYIHVRPERVYMWPGGDIAAEPRLFDAHMEEVRSGHNAEPEEGHADPEGGAGVWDERIDELGHRYPTAVLSIVAPDGVPFAVRVPVTPDRGAGVVRLDAVPLGVPLEPGLACLTAHVHSPDFKWHHNFQVRGDLRSDERGWHLVPHKLVGGMEAPKGRIAQYRANLPNVMRYRRTAKRELARRGG